MNNLFAISIIIVTILLVILYLFDKIVMRYTNYNYVIKNKVFSNKNKSYLNVGIWNNNTNLEKAQLNMFKKIYNMAELYKHQKVLETGCGSGEHYLYWVSLGLKSNITCFEKSTKPFPKLYNLKNVNFVQNDANNLNLVNHYDKIISIESAFHYKNREQFLKKCYNALKVGGSLIMTDIVVNSYKYKTYLIHF